MLTAIVTEPEPGQFRNPEVSPQWLQTGLSPSLLAQFSHEIRTHLIAQRAKKNLEFIVADDGQGIDNDDLPHIFERFYRGKSSRSGREGAAIRGLGQGLHFARAIAEAHGGSLEVESPPTKGATFILRIPFIETIDR